MRLVACTESAMVCPARDVRATRMCGECIGTMPVQERHRFDVGRLAQYLSANIEGFAGPLQVGQFEGGQSNPTFLLVTPTRRYVLRRKPPGKLLPSAHAVDREYRVITA